MRKYNLLFVIILCLFFCRELIGWDSLSLAEEIGSHTTRLSNTPISPTQVQVIRINPYDKKWENILESNLNYGDNVLILGHGIFTPKDKFSTNFASELASMRGYNKAVVLDYGWHVGTPFASTKAGYSLAKVASISMSETGNDPSVYGHSNFTVAINRSAYFITGSRLPWMPFLEPTKEMQNVRYKEVIFGGSPLDYEAKLDVLEGVISGRTQQGEAAMFNVYSPHDIATNTYQMYIDKSQIKFGLKWLGKSRNIKVKPQTLLGGSIYEHSRMVTDPSLYKTLPSIIDTPTSTYSLIDRLNSPIVVKKEAAEFFLETASTLEGALNYIDKSVPDINLASNIKDINDFANTLRQDLQSSRGSAFTALSSHTLEQLGKFGLGKIPDAVDALKNSGKLPSSFNLPATFGAEEFATAIGKHIGSGGADIDTITHYLDGLNQAAWGVVGYMVGGPEGAKAYQSIAGTGAKLFRGATLPLFNRAVLAWRGQGEELVKQWKTLQERRIYDGLPVQTVTEVYGEKLLLKNGVSRKDIQRVDEMAKNVNQNIINMKKDFSIDKINTFKQSGKMNLAGINIDTEQIFKYPPPICPPFCTTKSGAGLPNTKNSIFPLQSVPHNKRGDAAGVAGHIRGEEIEDTTGKIEEEGNLAKEAIKKTPSKSIFMEY